MVGVHANPLSSITTSPSSISLPPGYRSASTSDLLDSRWAVALSWRRAKSSCARGDAQPIDLHLAQAYSPCWLAAAWRMRASGSGQADALSVLEHQPPQRSHRHRLRRTSTLARGPRGEWPGGATSSSRSPVVEPRSSSVTFSRAAFERWEQARCVPPVPAAQRQPRPLPSLLMPGRPDTSSRRRYSLNRTVAASWVASSAHAGQHV